MGYVTLGKAVIPTYYIRSTRAAILVLCCCSLGRGSWPEAISIIKLCAKRRIFKRRGQNGMGQEANEGSSRDLRKETSTQILLKRVMMNGTADNWIGAGDVIIIIFPWPNPPLQINILHGMNY